MVAGIITGLACTHDASQSDQSSNGTPLSNVQQRREAVELSGATLESLKSGGTSEIILAFGEDGVIDFAEYEQGVFAFVACMEGYGWAASPGYPRLAPCGQYQVQFAPYTPATREARGASLTDLPSWEAECNQRYWMGLGRIWNARHSPSEEEEQNARYSVASCLIEAGVEIPEHPDEHRLFDLFFDEMNAGASVDRWVECIRSVKEQQFTSGTGIEFAP
ncbi:MAG: hypothetical protein KC482_04155 [Dehalococcoidia bacterium]|nr:hypothetical protein [Dehalococcoidia bacterium]MCA9845673.1 hypothetical protein [Dehalococcoidia bacterium]MCA9852776.1 hypothetical protein [Dehalococcoidia bacterium]